MTDYSAEVNNQSRRSITVYAGYKQAGPFKLCLDGSENKANDAT